MNRLLPSLRITWFALAGQSVSDSRAYQESGLDWILAYKLASQVSDDKTVAISKVR